MALLAAAAAPAAPRRPRAPILSDQNSCARSRSAPPPRPVPRPTPAARGALHLRRQFGAAHEVRGQQNWLRCIKATPRRTELPFDVWKLCAPRGGFNLSVLHARSTAARALIVLSCGCVLRAEHDFTWGKLTQCFEHCSQMLARQSPHFPHMLLEPGFAPRAALGAKPELFVRRSFFGCCGRLATSAARMGGKRG